MAAFNFDKDKAIKADGSGFISQGGVYNGEIVEARSFKTQKGASGVEFKLKDFSGSECDFVQVYTKNKDGSENFAKSKIYALMGLLGITSVDAVNGKKEGEYLFPSFTCKPIAFALQREDYVKKDGNIGYQMNLLHFFDSQTLKTYKEKVENLEAKVKDFEIKDKRLDRQTQDESNTSDDFNNAFVNECDLPF